MYILCKVLPLKRIEENCLKKIIAGPARLDTKHHLQPHWKNTESTLQIVNLFHFSSILKYQLASEAPEILLLVHFTTMSHNMSRRVSQRVSRHVVSEESAASGALSNILKTTSRHCWRSREPCRANHVPRLPRTEHPRTNRNSERSSLPRWQSSEPAPWHHRGKKTWANSLRSVGRDKQQYPLPSLASRKFWIANVVQGCVCIYICVCVYVV